MSWKSLSKFSAWTALPEGSAPSQYSHLRKRKSSSASIGKKAPFSERNFSSTLLASESAWESHLVPRPAEKREKTFDDKCVVVEVPPELRFPFSESVVQDPLFEEALQNKLPCLLGDLEILLLAQSKTRCCKSIDCKAVPRSEDFVVDKRLSAQSPLLRRIFLTL